MEGKENKNKKKQKKRVIKLSRPNLIISLSIIKKKMSSQTTQVLSSRQRQNQFFHQQSSTNFKLVRTGRLTEPAT
jgi:hypothetical protein